MERILPFAHDISISVNQVNMEFSELQRFLHEISACATTTIQFMIARKDMEKVLAEEKASRCRSRRRRHGRQSQWLR